jgi:putative ABC transport system permease protein
VSTQFTGSWRTALRIARRSALRNRGRTALVLLMLFLPAYAATVLVVSWANLSGTSAQETDFRMGRADLILSVDTPDTLAGLAATLPPGSRTVPVATGRTVVSTPGGGLAGYEYEATDPTDPVNRGRYVLRAGGVPHGAAEVALTRALAGALGVKPGDRIDAGMPQRRLTVVGIIDVSRSLALPALVVPADAPLSSGTYGTLSVDLPDGGPGWSPQTGRVGGYVDRKELAPTAAERALRAAATAVIVSFAAAQVVLLAGAAFLVGARRQRRELAMVAATGATPRQVGRIVLAGGLLIGTAAAAAGAALGLATFALAGPTIERIADHPLIDVSVPVWSVAGVAALTVAIGLAAAYLPARGAGRRPVRADLGGQRTRSRSDLVLLVLGLVLVVACAAALLVSARPDGRIELIAAGAVGLLLGVVACTPALVRAAGRVAPALPLSGRLALRHAARHRLRTAAALAAVTAAVAGSVALTLVGASHGKTDPLRREARDGQVLLPPESVGLLGPDGVRRLAATLPARETVALRTVTASARGNVYVQFPAPPSEDPNADPGQLIATDQRGIAVGGPETIRAVTGRAATGAELAALRDGGAVAFNDTMVADGQVTLGVGADHRDRIPAVVASRGEYFVNLPGMLISDDTARRLGLTVTPGPLLVDTTRAPRPDELAAATTVLLRAQLDASPIPPAPTSVEAAGVERAIVETDTMFYLLAAVSAVVTVVASVVAVGLAASELRGDLSTMAAVGATPGVRRRIAAAQAAVVVGLGTPLGLLAGIGPAAGYVAYNVNSDWHTPWAALLLIAVAPPMLATALAGGLTRTRLRLTRRTA